ncbi:MAG TPA: hypothetical protein VF773_00370 [Verrucomicrobiae bacterium]
MDEHRNYAYRHLLYWAMLVIRPIAWLPNGGQWFSPLFWRSHIRRVRALGELAEWLHNLAAFSKRDFADFDEQRFWDEFERLCAKHPDFQYYRSLFQIALTESQTGRWPSVEEQQKRDA